MRGMDSTFFNLEYKTNKGSPLAQVAAWSSTESVLPGRVKEVPGLPSEALPPTLRQCSKPSENPVGTENLFLAGDPAEAPTL